MRIEDAIAIQLLAMDYKRLEININAVDMFYLSDYMEHRLS